MQDFYWMHRGMTPAEIKTRHIECLGGVCGECKGHGDKECECFDCNNSHRAKCDHCDGTGDCRWNFTKDAERVEAALVEMQDLQDSLQYPLTLKGFTEAFTQMCGHPPTPVQVTEFEESIKSISNIYGVNI